MRNPGRRLCVDIDNVVARTDVVMREVIREFMQDKGGVCLRYEDVTRFEYQWCRDADGRGINKNQWTEVHDRFSVPAVIGSIEPMPHALEALRELSASGFEIHFVTSRKGEAEAATEDWLRRHFGALDYDVDIAPHRRKHKLDANFFTAIEDDLDQALLFLGLERDRQVHTQWEWVETGPAVVERSLVFAHPWNDHAEWCPREQRHQRLDQLHRLLDWPAISDLLRQFA